MKNLIFAAALLCSLTASVKAGDLAGYDKLTVAAPHRGVPVAASIWYPAGRKTYRIIIGENALFYGTPAYVGAAIEEGKHPLILLSHGSGGNMDNLGWLSSELALKGVIVLAVNHPGSTTGDSSPRRSIEIWNRTADLSSALDQLLADPQLAAYIDMDRIYSAGFSLGGLTALQLVGLQPDKGLFQSYCYRVGEAAHDCLFFAKGGVDLDALPEKKFNSAQTDPRLAGSVAIDPAMSYAFTDRSLKAASLPIRLINFGGPEDRWLAVDVGQAGSNLLARLPKADYVEIFPANHFTFLAKCKEGAAALLIEEGEDPICDDPRGTDRKRVHARVVEAFLSFLSR